jgi:hypothetical protein
MMRRPQRGAVRRIEPGQDAGGVADALEALVLTQV